MEIQKEVIVITGGAGGIGTACAKALKNEHLILTDYSTEKVNQAVDSLKKEGYKVSGIACDITNKNDVEKLTQFVSKAGSFKALIHTAGVSGTVPDLRKIYDIDLVATDLLIDAFHNLASNGSVAVLLASMMGYTVPPNEKYDNALRNPQESSSFETIVPFVDNNSDTMYNFVKRGVHLLAQQHVNKWGQKGARIVSLSPGVIETEMGLKAAEEHPEKIEMIRNATPLQRNGKPEDVADVVTFLISDSARFITGTDLLVDGGVIQNILKM